MTNGLQLRTAAFCSGSSAWQKGCQMACRYQLQPAILAAALVLGGTADAWAQDAGAGASDERALEIHDAVLTVDSHDDIPFDFATDAVDPLDAPRQVNLEKMRAGGLDVAFFIVYVGQTERTPANYVQAQTDAITKFDAIHRMAEELYPDLIEIAYSADDVERINTSGKLVAAIGIENGYVIGQDISLLERYHELGARYVTLAHNGHNDIADSAQPRANLGDALAEHGGISEFGEEVIAEMNRLGIMIDISHISRDAALDAIRLSRAPVMASHSNARGLTDHVRNLDDESLLALRDNGGVMQTTAFAGYLKEATAAEREATDAALAEFGIGGFGDWFSLSEGERDRLEARLGEIGYADVGNLIDHVDYAVELIGIDHVGLSSDFDGGGGIVGWFDAADSANVTLELVRRGYSEEEIAKLWGGNLLRVWREAERVAAESPQRGD